MMQMMIALTADSSADNLVVVVESHFLSFCYSVIVVESHFLSFCYLVNSHY